MNYKTNKFAILSCAFFVIYTLISFAFYYERTLQGDLNNHILAGEIFGVPDALKQHGIKPLYHGPASGWDGQFYYYMSNDLLAQKDTPKHIDAPSYRYQRIGLSLYTAVVAKVLGMNWVSPTLYFVSYFALILFATYVGAQLFRQFGSYPCLILLWSLSVGTQITLFNALPDAAADAFLIVGLGALFAKRNLLATLSFTFAALSREVYVLFPSCIFLFYLLDSISCSHAQGFSIKKALINLFKGHIYYLYLIPAIVAILWHIYIVHHFGIAPSEQAFGILGLPFVAWFYYFLSAVHGNLLLIGKGYGAICEAISLLFFLLILLFSIMISLNILVKRFRMVPIGVRGIAFASVLIVMLYSCFGPTVMMHYSGYFKAIGVLFFLLPVLVVAAKFSRKMVIFVISLLMAALVITTFYNMKVRVLPVLDIDKYTHISTINNNDRVACFGDYKAAITIESIRFSSQNVLLQLFSGNKKRMIVHVLLTNTSTHPFVSTNNFGSVFMSGQWVDEHNHVVSDGIRSAIPGVLQPGESAEIDVITSIPSRRGHYFFKLSPVQEGCAWFYVEKPGVTSSMQFIVGE